VAQVTLPSSCDLQVHATTRPSLTDIFWCDLFFNDFFLFYEIHTHLPICQTQRLTQCYSRRELSSLSVQFFDFAVEGLSDVDS
jgi:hypothetical protein